ncbi:MAG: hypothetical protein ACR2MO_11515, partial [Acidimicrobiales bacterium]
MSDQHPSEPGGASSAADGASDAPPPDGANWAGPDDTAGGPVADPTPAPPPAVPPIDLSKPEEPAPPSPVDGGPLVSAPDAEPMAAPQPVPSAGEAAPAGAGTPSAPPLPSEAAPPAAPPVGGEPEPSSSKGQVWKMALVVVVFLAVVVVAFVLGKRDGGDEDTATPSSTSTTVNVAPIDTAGWATFTDSQAGFTLKHPKDWLKLPTDGAERVVLQAGPESAAYVTVRNIDSEQAPEVIQQSLGGVTYVEGGEPANDVINGL